MSPDVRRVLVTRGPGSWPELENLLARDGVRLECRAPTRQVEPLDPAEAERAIDDLRSYTWIVFTSANGVRFFERRLVSRGLDRRSVPKRVAVIGEATANAAVRAGLRVSLVGAASGEGRLGQVLARRLEPSDAVLVVRPETRGAFDPAAIVERCSRVASAAFYRTEPSADAPRIAEDLADGRWGAVVVTAPSALSAVLGSPRGADARRTLASAVRVAIGPTTARALESAGLAAHAIATEPSASGIATALAAVW